MKNVPMDSYKPAIPFYEGNDIDDKWTVEAPLKFIISVGKLARHWYKMTSICKVKTDISKKSSYRYY